MKNLLITGGLGFLGGQFIQRILTSKKEYSILNIDKMTYASRSNLLFRNDGNPAYTELNIDLINLQTIPEDTDVIIHFAAETHVDTSFERPKTFFDSNILGTFQLLEVVRKLPQGKRPRIIYMSTDEVYGDTESIMHTEEMSLSPSNPYAATKAAAEQLFHGWTKSYNIPFVILRNTNNYGLGQHEEKFIPLCLQSMRSGIKIPIHGDGNQRRTWIHVDDTLDAIERMIEMNIKNEVFNVGGTENYSILEVIDLMARAFKMDPQKMVHFTTDRIVQDKNYLVDSSKLIATGWTPKRQLGHFIEKYAEKYRR